MHNEETPTEHAKENETETKPEIIANDYVNEESQPAPDELCSSDEKEFLDWNANKSSEIVTSNGCTGDMVEVTATECVGKKHESRSVEESMPYEATETHDGPPDSAAVTMVIASPSYSAPPATDLTDDDAPPPLPTTQPPSSLTPVYDSSQELSMLVEEKDSSSTAAIVSPPSPYANSEPDRSLLDSHPPAEQPQYQGFTEEDPIDEYSGLSEEDRLLIQRMLSTTNKPLNSASEEITTDKLIASTDLADNEPEEKYSDLSESDRKLIENTLTSSGQRQANSTIVPELQSQMYFDRDSNKNTREDGVEKESVISTKIEESSQNHSKDLSKEVAKDTVSLIERETKTSSHEPDQEPDSGTNIDTEHLSSGAEKETVIFSEMKVQESHQEQEEEKDEHAAVADVSAGITVEAALVDEPTTAADLLVSTTTSPADELKTLKSIDGRPESPRGSFEEPTTVSRKIKDTTVYRDEETNSANSLISTAATFSSKDTTDKENNEGTTPVDNLKENYPEPTVVISAHVGASEASKKEDSDAVGGKSTDEIFHNVGDNVPLDDANCDVETSDALSKSRRVLLSDEAVSGILRDYYTADVAEVVEETKKPEKPQPVKPLIAQALLPKVSRRGVATSSDHSTILAGATSQTSSSFSGSKLGYGQVKLPPAIAESGDLECRRAPEDGQSSEPAIGQRGDDVTRSRDSDTARESSVGADKSTDGEAGRDDDRRVPSVAESRAFFKSREAATKNSATVVDDSAIVASSQPVVSAVPRKSLPALFGAHSGVRRVADSPQGFVESSGHRGGTAPTTRVPPSARWTPKPFSFSTPVAKAGPTFVTFDPTIRTTKIPETSESEVVTVKATDVESVAPSMLAESSSSGGGPKSVVETDASEPKPKLSSSIAAVTKTAEAARSTERSSRAEEDELTSKSSDVELDAVGSTDVSDATAAATIHDKHPPVSATAMAAELKKKMPARTPSTSTGRSNWLKQVKDLSSGGVARSASVSDVDVHPSSERRVTSSGTNRVAPPTAAKSWTQFDCRRTSSPAQALGANSAAHEDESKAPSSEVDEDVEHIDVASSMAFFQAAEQADRQGSDRPVDKKAGKRQAQNSNVKTVAELRDDVEFALSSSSESSHSAHSAPCVTTLGEWLL